MLLRLSTLTVLLSAVLAIPKSEHSTVMQRLMGMKLEAHDKARAMGMYDRNLPAHTGTAAVCTNGKAGDYACDGVDMHAFLSHQDMGSQTGEGNDIWGWTSPDGREFGIVGQTDGTAFVEVNSDGSLTWLGRLPTQTTSSIWRDIKVIDHHAYISSEANNHGLQIFDLNKLLEIKAGSPVTFDINKDITHYTGFGSNHNVVANADTKFIYAVGSKTCKGGPHIINVADPEHPVAAGCVSQDGYTHDAQCVVYKGPDTRYTGKEICFNYNEDTLTIVDVSQKGKSVNDKVGVQISRTPYTGSAYTHQGWLIDDSMSMLLSDDELDEMDKTETGASGHTVTYLWDVSDLTKPVLTSNYKSPAKSIDHNQYTKKVGDKTYVFQSNYQSGLRVVDVTSAVTAKTTAAFKQVAFFDCYPEDDESGGEIDWNGSWSVYPWFRSGYILLNSIDRGTFSLKLTI